MASRRANVSRWAPIALWLVGGAVGFGTVALFPPKHPDDWLFAVTIAAGGFSTLGLLIGLLASLCLRRRINKALALSALTLPLASFGWFVTAKGGQWHTARWFAVVGFAAGIIFLTNAALLLSRGTSKGTD